MTINFKKNFKKYVKTRGVETLENIPIHLETIVTYCQTLEEVSRLLMLEKPKNRQQKNWLIKFYQKNRINLSY